MAQFKIADDDGKGFARAFIGSDIEYTDPVQYYSQMAISRNATLIKDMLTMENRFLASLLSEAFYVKHATKHWEKIHQEILNTAVPPNFIALLSADSKKEQVRLLKGQTLTPMQLIAFIFKSHAEHGFTFSSYTAEQHHKGVDESALPELIYVKDGSVQKSGETSMTDGELKNIVEQRRVTVSKFLDKNETWHCFFTVYRSLRGEESWKDGQPHFHYLSDKFNISREEALAQLKGDRYPTTSVRIGLLDY